MVMMLVGGVVLVLYRIHLTGQDVFVPTITRIVVKLVMYRIVNIISDNRHYQYN